MAILAKVLQELDRPIYNELLPHFHQPFATFVNEEYHKCMAEKSKTTSILNMTCPRCREGKLFQQPYSFSTAYKMHQKCPICHQNFEPEPGFYYGAMFISYILTGWIFILVGLALVFGLGWSATATILAVACIAVVLHNLFFRLSRSLWIHIFVKYDPEQRLSQNEHDVNALNN